MFKKLSVEIFIPGGNRARKKSKIIWLMLGRPGRETDWNDLPTMPQW